MVRVFPVHNSIAADGEGLIKVLVDIHEVVKASLHGHAKAQFAYICRKLHRSHSPGFFYGANPLNFSFSLILLELIFIIFTIRVVRFLLKPLRQPRIISQVLGGMIIGPSILGRNREFKNTIFPDNADFVLRNMGAMGFIYFLFVAGVKMDLSLVKKAGRKHYYVAFIGVAVPFVMVSITGFVLRSSMDKSLARVSSIGGVAASLAITCFPVIHIILKDLNLLNSEVGRFAMSVSIIGDALGMNALVAFEAIKQGETGAKHAIWYLISLVILVAFVVTAVRRAMTWIVEKTPQGKPVEECYVVAILLGVPVMSFLTDMFGIAMANGPLWLGLAIPDGPPLGATLVERSETILTELFLPFSFAFIGLYTNVFAMGDAGWQSLAPMFAMCLTGYISKFVTTAVTAFVFQMPLKDSLALGIILNVRGLVEILIYLHWVDKRIINLDLFALLVVLTVAVTGLTTPFVTLFYDPTRPYMVNKRRTIQHTPQCSELRLVLCIPDQQSMAGLISLLEFSYPTTTNPFYIHALYLRQLVARAAPIFIDHDEQGEDNKYVADYAVNNALKLYQETRHEFVKLHGYTAVAPIRTMYRDICELAMVNKTSFIVLPFQRETVDGMAGTRLLDSDLRSVNSDVLDHAPCSVGVLYDKGSLENPLVARSMEHMTYRFAILFLGGADAREALAYADRMAANPDITITVIRFLSHNFEGDIELEKKLDDGVVTWFWVKNETNDRVVYREVVVRNGAETLAAIQAINDGNYDLWITGRKHGMNPKLVEGISTWSEHNVEQLGVIGDYIASDDFGGSASVLVIQQQVLRSGQEAVTGNCLQKNCNNVTCKSILSWWV